MMQKRKSYLSLLLASFLLLFTYSFATAQTYEISFENKDVPRCVTADMSIYVTNDTPLGAFEAIFEVGGDFTGFSVDLATLPFSTNVTIDGNVVRIAGFMGADPGDACLPAGTNTVGTLHFETADLCSGAITVASATVDDPFTHGSLFVGCDPIEEITPTFVAGLLTIANQAPELTYCPDPITVHFGETVVFDVTGGDNDNCENIIYSLRKAPDGPTPDGVTINPSTGHVTWGTGGEDVCDNQIVVRLTDKCGAYDECTIDVCVQNTPPAFTDDGATGWMDDTIYCVMGIVLSGSVEASDFGPYLGPSALHYSIVSFDGPTGYGSGLQINSGTGDWTWDIADNDMAYTGDFELCLAVDDGAAVCDPCSPTNADTVCLSIHVTGYFISIECEAGDEGKGVIQGTTATVSIDLLDLGMPYDPIGGYDFLVAYDASALTALNAEAGELIDTEFEYFTYRFVDNCGGGCPTGVLHIVALRESNDGVTNTAPPVTGPGELAKMNFRVSSDLTFECQSVPIRFFWRDCGDNTLSDESGNILFLGLHVYDNEGTEITDPFEYGFSGPMAECYDTVSTDPFKAPLGAILFQDGCIKIICIQDIDDRGDVNLNGIAYEVADAVVFTNYFIDGMSAFTINPSGQLAATDVNADGTPLSVADLVYLIRIIVGDALPYPNSYKLTPSDPIDVGFNGSVVDLRGTTRVGAALFVFDNEVIPTLANNASYMDIKYGYVDGMTRVLVYSMDHSALEAGNVLNVEGDANIIDIQAADNFGAPLEVEKTIVVPTEFALLQNYPNPFNPETVIGLALPVASNWNIAIYNVSGQLVKEFGGTSEAGVVQVTWDATNVASGMYFYKATTDQFSATKKMVLLK
jgi:hypothetical protein